MSFCLKCGEAISKSWKHCPVCGQSVKKIISPELASAKLVSTEATYPEVKKLEYKGKIAFVLVAILALSVGLFTVSQSGSDSSNSLDPKSRLNEGPELHQLVGVENYKMAELDASWTKERFVMPVDDFISSRRNCDMDTFLNPFTSIDFAGTYRIEGSPDFMIQTPEAYEFATPFEKAMHLVLAYAVPLRTLEEYVYYDKKQKRSYSKQFESYKSDVLLAAKSLCSQVNGSLVQDATQAESVIKKFTDEKFRKTYLDFTENKVLSTYVYKYEDDGKVFCEEKETSLDGIKIVKCYP